MKILQIPADLQGKSRRSKQMRVAREGKRNLVLFNQIGSEKFRPKDGRDNFFYLKYDSDQISPRNLKPYFPAPKSQPQPVHHAKLITIKNYNSISKPNLPVKTVSSSTVQFADSSDRQTKRKGNLIVAKSENPSVATKRQRKDSESLPNGRRPAWKLTKKKKNNKKNQKNEINLESQSDKKKRLKKQGNSKY